MSLHIFPKHPSADAYYVGGSYVPYAIVARDKRLTDAELAAEFEACRCDYMIQHATGSYWAPLGETWPHDQKSVGRRTSALMRFAILPHYDEPEV